MDGQQELRQMLRGCLVQIDEAHRMGSGFFVAPGWVLTCAHVVPGATGRPVTGWWEGRSWRGTVEYASSGGDGGLWPLPDLAVIRLGGVLDHPCVRLAGRPATEGGTMVAVGRLPDLGRVVGLPMDLHYPGPSGTDGPDGGGLLRLVGDRLGAGMSGGPVLDLQTGEVCAVLKTARSQPEGYAVPVSALGAALPADLRRALWQDHDRYHGAHPGWARAQGRLRPAAPWSGGPLLPPPDEAELLALAARLPEPPDLLRLREQCLPELPAPDHPGPRDLRDTLLWLADRMHEPGRLHPVLAAAEVLAEMAAPDLAGPLREWAVAAATRQYGGTHLLRAWREQRRDQRPARASADDPNSVIARVQPSPHDHREYGLTMWLYRSGGDMAVFHQDEGTRPLEEVWATLQDRMRPALRQLPGLPTLVELVLPPYLFDTAADKWELFRRGYADPDRGTESAPRHYVKLGYRYPVVVRDLERFGDEDSRNHTRPRWDALRRLGEVPLRWLHCDEQVDEDWLYRWFESSPERAALGVPGPAGEEPGRSSLDAAISAGVPVAIWCRDRCADHAVAVERQQPCAGARFRRGVEVSLSGRGLCDLPEWVRTRRLRADVPEQRPDDETTLLWDDPDRTPDDDPLLSLRPSLGGS